MSPPGEGGPCLPPQGPPGDPAAPSREADTRVTTVCGRCLHPRSSHWEVGEPSGSRRGCGLVGCTCTGYRP